MGQPLGCLQVSILLSLCLFNSNMKILAVALFGLPYLVAAMQLPNGVEINVDDIDPEDNVDEDQFVKDFDLPEVTDPEEKARRQAALKANEALIKEENEAYSRGEKTGSTPSTSLPTCLRTSSRLRRLATRPLLTTGPMGEVFLSPQVLTGWTLRLSSTLPNFVGQ